MPEFFSYPFYRLVGVPLLLMSFGAFLTYQSSHKEARQYFEHIVQRKPIGFLVLKSNNPKARYMSSIIDLAGNFGSSPGMKYRSYGTSNTIDDEGKLSKIVVRFVPEDTIYFGNPLLIQIDLPSGVKQDFIVKNGDFKIIYQDKEYTLEYKSSSKSNI